MRPGPRPIARHSGVHNDAPVFVRQDGTIARSKTCARRFGIGLWCILSRHAFTAATSENRHSDRRTRSMRNVGTKWERSHSEDRPVRAAGSSLKCTSLRREGRDVRSPARAVWGVLCAIAPLKKWECEKGLPHRNWVVVAQTKWRTRSRQRLPIHRGTFVSPRTSNERHERRQGVAPIFKTGIPRLR